MPYKTRFWIIYSVSIAIAFLPAVAIFLFSLNTTICNPGIVFAIALPSWILISLTFCILAWLSREAHQNWSKQRFLPTFGFIFMFTGGLSNLLERLLFGCVHDFLHLPWHILNNPADYLIALGCTLVIASMLKRE